MAIPLIAIAAAAGLLKGLTVDKAKEERDRKLAAETQRLSPWTGLKAGPIQEADPLGSALAFGMTGHQIQGGMAQADLNKKLAEKALAMSTPQANVNVGGGYGGMGGFNPSTGFENWQWQPGQSAWGGVRNYGY